MAKLLCVQNKAKPHTNPQSLFVVLRFAVAKHSLDFCPETYQMRFSFHLPAAA
jgi:hypothetical protein